MPGKIAGLLAVATSFQAGSPDKRPLLADQESGSKFSVAFLCANITAQLLCSRLPCAYLPAFTHPP